MRENDKRKYLTFLRKHADLFSDFQLQYLESYTKEDLRKLFPVPDGIREILDEVGLLTPRQDSYSGFVELLCDKFDLEGKEIVEIGGGMFPRLAERLSKIPNIKKVTVYDPRICSDRKDTNIIKFVRRKVSRWDDDVHGDIFVGFKPCKGAEAIIGLATRTNTDFMISLCEGGAHGDEFDYFEDEYEWLCSILYEAEVGCANSKMGKLKQLSMKKYGDSYPVIYNDRNCTD